MARCLWIRRKFQGAIPDELTAVEKEEFESHLRTCRECSRQFRQLRSVDTLVAAYGKQKLPESLRRGYWPEVSRRLKRSELFVARPRRFAWTLVPSIAGALVALAIVWAGGHISSSRRYERLLLAVEQLQSGAAEVDTARLAGFEQPGLGELTLGSSGQDFLAFDFDEAVRDATARHLELVPLNSGYPQQWL